ncbi:S41 family peptidase [Streptomyces sp. P1-3]|uniref:S41 family peptidase n=1 Tax=Streptomyces sp. P1-3 TaxID=3421658 RepID=UPI003D3683C2
MPGSAAPRSRRAPGSRRPGRPLIGDRLAITGARWGLTGVEAVIRLRARISNGDFDPYRRYHLACEHEHLYPARNKERNDARDRARLLVRVLNLIQENALNRRKVDWEGFRREAYEAIADATSPRETYDQIRKAITALDDPHTVFLTPDEVATAFSEEATAAAPMPSGRLVDGHHPLVVVPEATGTEEADRRYVDTGAALIREPDAHRPDGWVVDLRGNTGGNMYPMMTVLAPLLGDGPLGSFVDGDGKTTGRWSLCDGIVYHDEEAMSPVPNPYLPAVSQARVAVLIDGETMSAAEATLIAFLGKENVRTACVRQRSHPAGQDHARTGCSRLRRGMAPDLNDEAPPPGLAPTPYCSSLSTNGAVVAPTSSRLEVPSEELHPCRRHSTPGAVRRVAEPVREAVTRQEGRVGLHARERERRRQQGLLVLGWFAPPSYQEALLADETVAELEMIVGFDDELGTESTRTSRSSGNDCARPPTGCRPGPERAHPCWRSRR